jgi:hypothetical protein
VSSGHTITEVLTARGLATPEVLARLDVDAMTGRV